MPDDKILNVTSSGAAKTAIEDALKNARSGEKPAVEKPTKNAKPTEAEAIKQGQYWRTIEKERVAKPPGGHTLK